jgi:tRNA G10  N-methylase Trm11
MREEIIKSRGYNSNISGDDLSLKIASYPATARYLTDRLRDKGTTVCELCCGIGVSLIELSKSFTKVIGVDSNSTIIDDCRKNLEGAEVANYELLCGDVSNRELLGKISADVVLYDIPYWSTHAGKVNPEEQNPNLPKLIFDIRELITDRIVIYAPTHFTYEEATAELGDCEYMKVYINGKHDRNFIFLGKLAQKNGLAEIEL